MPWTSTISYRTCQEKIWRCRFGRSRSRVDAQVFQPLTSQAHLKQPSVHQTCALVLTMMRVLAYIVTLVFCHCQVLTHARRVVPSYSEMARLLAYLFLSPRLESS
jgi:hypothetical protein